MCAHTRAHSPKPAAETRNSGMYLHSHLVRLTFRLPQIAPRSFGKTHTHTVSLQTNVFRKNTIIIYYYVKNAIKNIISSQTGGAQQHINRQNVYDANLLVPKKEVIKKYFKISKPILDIISDNCFQIQSLTKTRDALLPKLMSGEIRV